MAADWIVKSHSTKFGTPNPWTVAEERALWKYLELYGNGGPEIKSIDNEGEKKLLERSAGALLEKAASLKLRFLIHSLGSLPVKCRDINLGKIRGARLRRRGIDENRVCNNWIEQCREICACRTVHDKGTLTSLGNAVQDESSLRQYNKASLELVAPGKDHSAFLDRSISDNICVRCGTRFPSASLQYKLVVHKSHAGLTRLLTHKTVTLVAINVQVGVIVGFIMRFGALRQIQHRQRNQIHLQIN